MAFRNCSDSLVNALKAAGCNIIRLPETGVKPLRRLSRTEFFSVTGDARTRFGDL
jgi:hypothetical protein